MGGMGQESEMEALRLGEVALGVRPGERGWWMKPKCSIEGCVFRRQSQQDFLLALILFMRDESKMT